MKDFLVELRGKRGEPPVVMTPETYASLPDDDPLLDCPAHLIYSCAHCHTVHELGTWEEFAAVIFSRVRREFSETCVVDRVRGGQ